ncbi:MAG: hypothetical protein HYY76_05755 [Acidobacteria bacterium]|nr:hypothetical protein [Acidobacteriota bacterium]
MKIGILAVAASIAALPVAAAVAPQHEGHQAGSAADPGAAAVAQCAQAQRAIAATLDAAGARLEAARQTNSPAAMRAAIDDLQAVLRDVRTRLAACAALGASSAADPHAGHIMPPAPSNDRR